MVFHQRPSPGGRVEPRPYRAATLSTIALPPLVNSVALGDALLEAGYELSYKSRYLVERNWIQICLMGEHAPQTVRAMLAVFRAQVEHLAAGETAG